MCIDNFADRSANGRRRDSRSRRRSRLLFDPTSTTTVVEAAALTSFVSRLPQDAKPLVGNVAPDFTAEVVLDQEFVTKSLGDYRGKYLVLFFYPLDFTFVCPTEITSFSDRYEEFKSLNCEVLGVSVDSQFSHLAWIQTPRNEGGIGDINYGLVADLKKEVSTAYNVLTDDGIALRGLFIIDREGVIQHSTINNLAFGRSVDETLRVLQAIQHIQANPDVRRSHHWSTYGAYHLLPLLIPCPLTPHFPRSPIFQEVCPAGWTPGDKTMVR